MLHLRSFALRGPRLAVALSVAISAICLAGCDEDDSVCIVSAVRPFYTAQEFNTDNTLTGAWQFDEEVTFIFTPVENGTYKVVVEESEGDKHYTSQFEGHLFRLGPDSFLDLYPTSVPDGSEFYLLHFFRCHTVAKVDFRGDQLEMRFFSPAWLAQQIKAGTVNIAYIKSDEILLLTATTQEMQDLLYLNASDEKAFGEALLFDRTRDEEAR